MKEWMILLKELKIQYQLKLIKMVDNEIREVLCNYIDERFDKVRIMDEFVVGKSRADIVTVTNRLTGYEIKGDTDTYTRLPLQIKEYNRCFQENYLVVGKSHKKSAEKHIPKNWGILCVSISHDCPNIEILRVAEVSEKNSIIKSQLGLLWRNELVNILKRNGLKKCAGKTKSFIRRFLWMNVLPERLQEQICDELFERDWTVFNKG